MSRPMRPGKVTQGKAVRIRANHFKVECKLPEAQHWDVEIEVESFDGECTDESQAVTVHVIISPSSPRQSRRRHCKCRFQFSAPGNKVSGSCSRFHSLQCHDRLSSAAELVRMVLLFEAVLPCPDAGKPAMSSSGVAGRVVAKALPTSVCRCAPCPLSSQSHWASGSRVAGLPLCIRTHFRFSESGSIFCPMREL